MSGSESVLARLQAEVRGGRLTADPAQSEAAALLDDLRKRLDDRRGHWTQRLLARVPSTMLRSQDRPEPGLYLWGGVGRGKTLLMDMFCASLAAPDPPRPAAAPPVALRLHFYRFMQYVHTELAGVKRREDPLSAVAQRLARRARVLCIDEFLVADIADAMILAGLLEGLFHQGVALVATSNLPPQALYKDGLQRQRFLPAVDLIAKHVRVFHLDGGTDYRLRQLEQAPTYLDALAPSTPTLMRARFDALAGAASSALPLIIEGRTLHAVAVAPGMVWFDFAELCAGPRSQNDYIELARLYHTLFIGGIPKFSATSDDAARRFIMLIDELYDRSVNVVVSAAAPPAELYHGERLQFEFERAASRLIEMQTHEYHAREHRP